MASALGRQIQARLRLAAAMERGLASDVANWLARVGRIAAAHLRAGHVHAAEHAGHEIRHRLERMLRARMIAAAEASVRLLLAEGKSAGAMEVKGLIANILQAATGWIKGYAANRVTQIAETTRKTLRRIIDRGQGTAETPPQPPRVIAKTIVEATSGAIGKRRALRIARTEIHGATERANFQATREMTKVLGDPYVKVWNAVHDHRTRPDHAAANGQTVDIDQPFRVGGAAMMFCGDPNGPPEQTINCRCVTTYLPVTLAQAA